MKKPMLVWVAIAVIILIGGGIFLAMRGNDKDNTAEPSTTSPATTEQTNGSSNPDSTAPASTAQSTTVDIMDMAFTPASISVKKGSTVTWTNKDSIAHTVTADDSNTLSGFGSNTLSNGDTYSFTFNKAGTFNYHCSIHSEMKGTVTVSE